MASHISPHVPFQVSVLEMRKKVGIQPMKKNRGVEEEGSACAWPSSLTPRPKKTRKASGKSRDGCKVCKRRHKKCDETRPVCNRCALEGWKCDYSPALPIVIVTPKIPSPPSPLSPIELFDSHEEAHYLQYLWSTFQAKANFPFETPVWKVVLQMCRSEPCIKHGTLAASSIHFIYRSMMNDPSNPSQLGTYRRAFWHYQQAVKLLNKRLANLPLPSGQADSATWEVSLTSNMLFCFFEVLVGNEEGAYWHQQSGLNLTKYMLAEHADNATLPGNLEDITNVFNSMDIQASTSSIGYQTRALRPPRCPDTFRDLTGAKTALESLLANILAVIRSPPDLPEDSSTYPLGTLTPPLAKLKAQLQHWLGVFNALLRSLGEDLTRPPTEPVSTKRRIGHHILLIQYWAALLWIHTPFTASQMVYDPYLPNFVMIVELAESIFEMQPERKNMYSAETGFIHILFYTAQRCRDGAVRRRAVAAMSCAREGVWDGQSTAAACKWLIEKEEEGLPPNMLGSVDPKSPGFVRASRRLRGANIGMNRFGRIVRVTCSRTRDDGCEEVVEGFVSWGEGGVASIVYGEPEKLWQKLSLFPS